ncbi:MAG TPA: TonB family protein [Terriglobia bacterium]|jgi:TonB family protein
MRTVTRICFWIVTGLPVTGMSLMAQTIPPSIQARDILNQGVAAFRNTHYESAIELFKQAVQIDSDFTTAELYLATAYAQLFVPSQQTRENLALADNAIESFKRVLKQDPDNTPALLGLGSIYQTANRYQEARDTFLFVSKSNPQNPIPFYKIGAIDWELVFDRNRPLPLGEQSLLIDEGLNNLDSALALDPQNEDAMMYENILLREKARRAVDPQEETRLTRLADEWFNRALEIRKNNTPTRGGFPPLPPPLPPPPPQSTPSGSDVRVASTLRAPTLIRKVPPVYPQLARDNHIEGVVVLEATINKDGIVENLNVVNGHPLLIPAAIEAVKQWVYKPVLLNGEPVGTVTTVTVNFALSQ